MHEVVMSHVFWPGSGLQVGHESRVSRALVGCAKVEGRRARRRREVKMVFMVEDWLNWVLLVVVVVVMVVVVSL